MPHVDGWISLRRAHAAAYDEALRDLPGLDVIEGLPETSWNGAIYTLRVREGRRDALRRYLTEQGVETRIYYDPPLHRQPVFGRAGTESETLPEAELASRQVLSLPLYPELAQEQREWVVDCVRRFFGG
jgi:dTDP-4-amino-4,6-dideoxygalactose transaminase